MPLKLLSHLKLKTIILYDIIMMFNLNLILKKMHESTLDLFEKCAIDPNDIEALAAYYEVTCDYYMDEFLGLEEYEGE